MDEVAFGSGPFTLAWRRLMLRSDDWLGIRKGGLYNNEGNTRTCMYFHLVLLINTWAIIHYYECVLESLRVSRFTSALA
jgi:hypothetical protein